MVRQLRTSLSERCDSVTTGTQPLDSWGKMGYDTHVNQRETPHYALLFTQHSNDSHP